MATPTGAEHRDLEQRFKNLENAVRDRPSVGLPLPAGTCVVWAGGAIPFGFLACAGAAVSRTTYAGVFAAIGVAFGVGDGSTTFNLPNLTADAPSGTAYMIKT